MQRLDGHWVAKRVGIIEHYKGMTLAEIVLFDAYLLLANKQTWETWRSIRQLEKILPMQKDTIVRAKRALIKRGWIEKVGQSGVFIPKLYRYSQVSGNGEQVSESREQQVSANREQMSVNREQKIGDIGQVSVNREQVSESREQKVAFKGTIIEEGYLIDDHNNNLGMPKKIEISGLCKLSEDERLYLNLLKSIPNYPFNLKKDVSFIRDLLVDFPTLDLREEIKNWKTWLLDKKLKKEINYRSRLRRWLTNSIRYMEEKKYGKHGYHEGQSKTYGEKKSFPVPGRQTGRKGFDLPSDYPIDVSSELDREDQGT